MPPNAPHAPISPDVLAKSYADAFTVKRELCPSGVVLTVSAPPCYSYAAACRDQAQADSFLADAKEQARAALEMLLTSHSRMGYVEDGDVMQEIYVGSLVSGLMLVAEQSGATAFEQGTVQ